MTAALSIRNMSRSEVDELIAWAATEGWNPGLHDGDVFWENDPEAFVAADFGDEPMVGAGAITSYGGEFGFMGFFIVRPEHRGRGLGNALWHARRERLIARLRPGATIGMDGVFAMQEYYAKGGFVLSHRNIRYRVDVPADATVPGRGEGEVVALAHVAFDDVLAYDRTCFPAARRAFLERWIAPPAGRALGVLRGGRLAGYGVVRRCGEGCKIGPLFADDAAAAETLFARLAPFAAGGPVFLDAPENNAGAVSLVRRHGMVEVFGCARMYLGAVPDIAHGRVFGVTTFELG